MPRRSPYGGKRGQRSPATGGSDRKSTRLNSSHTVISYAVFCLKKKKHTAEVQSHSDHVCRPLLEEISKPVDKSVQLIYAYRVYHVALDVYMFVRSARVPATHLE